MGKSRRNFLKTGALAALAVGVPASLTQSVSAKSLAGLLAADHELAKANFARCLHTTFRVHTSGSNFVDLKLTRITDLKRRAKSDREVFSLLFEGAPDTALRQGTYSIQHDKLGKLWLLMVPIVSRRSQQPHYEVVINQG